jgi:RND family efflux transporter MFP subunit
VIADVYASDVSRVRIAQPARFEAGALPGETFAGKVQFVHPNVDPTTRTLRVRLELRNRAGAAGLQLRPGMYGDVTLDLPASDALTVPSEAIVDTGDAQYAFIDKGGGHYEPRAVQVGARSGDRVVVTKGLVEGDTVVTTANFLIDSESRLRAAVEGHAAPHH